MEDKIKEILADALSPLIYKEPDGYHEDDTYYLSDEDINNIAAASVPLYKPPEKVLLSDIEIQTAISEG